MNPPLRVLIIEDESVPLDLPAGPLIVCTLAALSLITAGVRRMLR